MTLDWKNLLDPKSTLVSFSTGDEEALDDFAVAAPDDTAATIRIVRGKRCTTREQLFQEWAAALQFPSYFGENWDALEECLSDLEWLTAGGLVLFVTQADRLLEYSPDDLSTFGDVVKTAAKEWKKSHPAAPFHLVFHATLDAEAKARERLAAAGLMPHY